VSLQRIKGNAGYFYILVMIKMTKKIALISILLTWIFTNGCVSEGNFLRIHSPTETNHGVSINLIPEKSEYNLHDVSSGSVKFYALIKNHGNRPITIAHPTICLPEDYQMGKSYHLKDHHGKSEILLRVTKPDNKTLILRDGPYYFDPKMIDRFIIRPGESTQFYVGWFFQHARGRWEDDLLAAKLFSTKGQYKVSLLYRNFFSKAAVYDRNTNKTNIIKVWTGEILSNEVMVIIK